MSRYTYSTTLSVDVDVDIDETDLSDDDLIEICQQRGLMSGGLNKDVIDELHDLFKLKKHDAILERMRQVVQNAKGVVL